MENNTYSIEYGVQKTLEDAIRMLERGCNNNEVFCFRMLGQYYIAPKNSKRNLSKAIAILNQGINCCKRIIKSENLKEVACNSDECRIMLENLSIAYYLRSKELENERSEKDLSKSVYCMCIAAIGGRTSTYSYVEQFYLMEKTKQYVVNYLYGYVELINNKLKSKEKPTATECQFIGFLNDYGINYNYDMESALFWFKESEKLGSYPSKEYLQNRDEYQAKQSYFRKMKNGELKELEIFDDFYYLCNLSLDGMWNNYGKDEDKPLSFWEEIMYAILFLFIIFIVILLIIKFGIPIVKLIILLIEMLIDLIRGLL